MAATPPPATAAAAAGGRLPRKGPSAEDEANLLEPYKYITSVPGKEVRRMLINAFNTWLKIPEDKVEVINDVTKMLHNASLLIDDIEDNSQLRRGIPVAHKVYGIAQTINCANYVYFKCLQMVQGLGSQEATVAFTEQLLELHVGQGLDIFWRDSMQCPTEEQYKDMVKQKTGGLFLLAIRLMQVYSECQDDFSPLLDALGLYFQIRDDYANMRSKEYIENKSFAEDLTEGKFSFPIIHCIQTAKSHEVMNILRQRTDDFDLKKHCVGCMEAAGSFQYTREVLDGLAADIVRLVEERGGNAILLKLVTLLRKVHTEE